MLNRLGIISITFLLLFSCKSRQEQTNPREEKITESVYASGNVKSNNQYQVFSTVSGLAEEILVKEGDLVKKGDPLIRIANANAQLNLENAQISAGYSSVAANEEKIRELKNNIDLAADKMKTDGSLLERQKNLWSQQIGTRNEVEQREISYKTSVNAYEAAKLRLEQLQKQLTFQARQSGKNAEISGSIARDYTIKSETDGKVYSMLKKKGEMVNTQSPVALVGDAGVFTLELQVDEYDIARVNAGQKIWLSMDSYKGQVFEAVVNKVNPLMNEQTKSFMIEASFVKQPPVLFPNLTCEANIVISEKEKALTIPAGYLLEGGYVLLKNKEKRKVTTGLKDYQKVEILSGLTTRDIIYKPAP